GAFSGVLAEHVFAERPRDGFEAPLDGRWARVVAALFARHANDIAAVIVEPVVQGAGGMRFHSPDCVALLRELCDEHGALLVLDEIATGFGRTGAMFACEHAHVAPDVMCVGKALTGGYMTLAATICTRAVADAISAGATAAALEQGVWLRPFRDLVYTMPPYVIEEADLALVAAAVVAAAAAASPR